MMPGDNESDPGEILRYLPLLDHVDFVVPFIFNKEVRTPLRNLISWLYRTIVNTTFLVNFNYTNGTVLYRRQVLQRIEKHDTGFFYNTDVLMRLARQGYLYAEVPCRLKTRAHGPSKAITLRALARVVRGYLRLVRGLYLHGPGPRDFCEKSRTFQRRAEAVALTAGELLELAPPAERHAYARLDS